MRIQPIIGITVFVLSSAALAFAQGGPPTGIQRAGALSLIRSESKFAV